MTNDIQFRIAEMADLPFLHKLFNDPAIMDYWFKEPYMSVQQMKEDLEKQSEQTRLFIIENNQQEQVGIVAFYFIDHRHRHAEFAIALDPIHQGKGYATIVTKQAINYAFLVLNLRKVYLIVADINEKASHIYEKVGFKFEGKLKEHYFINGNYHDAIVMGIFAESYTHSKQ